jgi:hypothetical protein
VIGIVISLMFRRQFGFNAGGIVVPAFLAVILSQSWLAFVAVFLLSFVVYFLYSLTFGKKALRGRYPILVKTLYSVVLVSVLTYFLKIFNGMEFAVVGYVVPGLIAASYRRNHIWGVAAGTLGVSLVIYALGSVLGFLIPSSILNFTAIKRKELGLAPFSLDYQSIQFGGSIVVALIAYIKSKARVGGLIVLPIVAALFFSPINLLLFGLVTALVYLIVQFVQRHAHLIGLDRFMFATVVSVALVWFVESILLGFGVGFAPLFLSVLLMPITVSVYVNDLAIQGIKRSVVPFSLAIVTAVLARVISSFLVIL